MSDIGPFWLNDNPATPIEIDLSGSEDMTAYTQATVALRDPDWDLVASIGPVDITEDETITFNIPTSSFTKGGVYSLVPRIQGATGAVSLPLVAFVVQEEDGWHTLDSARAEFPTWDGMDDVVLHDLLDTAKLQCVAFAPAFDGRPPSNVKKGQLMQARGIWQSVRANTGDTFGGDGYSVTVYPLDGTVKQMLRPRSGVPAFR